MLSPCHRKFALILLVTLLSSLIRAPLGIAQSATNTAFDVSVATSDVIIRKNPVETLLKILIRDATPRTGVCTYYQKSFQFVPEKKEIAIEIAKDFCPNDRFGKSQGEVDWIVPKTLINSKKKICVYVNGFKVGGIVFDESTKSFLVTEGCN